ncbi:class I SAM-dependent methyltransferase [Pseudoalteromonas umbrosa]|uniref:class I SAM-dependent methyltransferase n=1 Tax=Pseudoalteromonas umbrosa TaxID=3048489 RepID=UPI0024C29C38|nr:class I SAM-dependent methyltransferase [Pseudoalteromonas sp. B95]MDK1285601.1 class I SAM-dependent methyltransferase [Pseudoalteromonas sp. B95]
MASWESIYQSGQQLNKYPFSEIVSLIFQMKKSNQSLKVLELGCGAGNNIYFMASEGIQCAGIDCSPSALRFATSRIEESQLTADLRVGCFTNLPWSANSFDLVIDRSALNCVPREQIKTALQQVHRVLKPGGRIFSQIYADSHPAHHSALNTSPEFSKGMLHEGFQDIDGLFFASALDIKQLFGHFVKTSVSLNKAETLSGRITSAQWSIIAYKSDVDQS